MLSVANLTVDFFLKSIMPRRRAYIKYKYEKTIDFSDVEPDDVDPITIEDVTGRFAIKSDAFAARSVQRDIKLSLLGRDGKRAEASAL